MSRLSLAWTMLESLVNDHGVGSEITKEVFQTIKTVHDIVEDELIDKGLM